MEHYIVKKVPKVIIKRAEENYYKYNMSVLDSFEEAVRNFAKKGTELWKAWYWDDFRAFIPSEYREEYLDFEKYPLKYANK